MHRKILWKNHEQILCPAPKNHERTTVPCPQMPYQYSHPYPLFLSLSLPHTSNRYSIPDLNLKNKSRSDTRLARPTYFPHIVRRSVRCQNPTKRAPKTSVAMMPTRPNTQLAWTTPGKQADGFVVHLKTASREQPVANHHLSQTKHLNRQHVSQTFIPNGQRNERPYI